MRRKLATAPWLIAVIVALVVSACGGSSNDKSSSSSSTTAGAKSLKGQTIEYWASNQAGTIDQDKQVIKPTRSRASRSRRA